MLANVFVILVEMGFCHVAQTGVELLDLSNLPTLVSQSTGITGVSHCAQLISFSYLIALVRTSNPMLNNSHSKIENLCLIPKLKGNTPTFCEALIPTFDPFFHKLDRVVSAT